MSSLSLSFAGDKGLLGVASFVMARHLFSKAWQKHPHTVIQVIQHWMWFMEDPSQFSMDQTAQSLTCSLMAKPHTGSDDCLRVLLSCFRKRMSGDGVPIYDCSSIFRFGIEYANVSVTDERGRRSALREVSLQVDPTRECWKSRNLHSVFNRISVDIPNNLAPCFRQHPIAECVSFAKRSLSNGTRCECGYSMACLKNGTIRPQSHNKLLKIPTSTSTIWLPARAKLFPYLLWPYPHHSCTSAITFFQSHTKPHET